MSTFARTVAVLALLLLTTACGTGTATQPPAASQALPGRSPGTGPATTVAPAGTPTTATPAVPTVATAPPGGDLPGPVGFRIVHLYTHPDGTAPTLELFARSDGLVRAYPVQSGVSLGSVIDYIKPPAGGGVIAMETDGTGEPTCITNCSHFVLEATASGGEGDRRTVLVYPESPSFIVNQTPSELAGTIEFWEDPKPASVGVYGNALMPADPARGLLFVVGAGVPEARFGLRLALVDKPGCQESINLPGGMIGGNQVPAYAIASDANVTLHGGSDADCSKPPVGGPFPVGAPAGSRGYLFLYGTFADLKALDLPID